MPYYSQPQNCPTLAGAIERCTVDELKKLAGLLPDKPVPTRKADLVAFMLKHLQEKALPQLWQRYDRLQQAVIAEVVHSTEDYYQPDRFLAKYGELPNWGTGSVYSYQFQPSLLNLFFYGGWMPQDLKAQLQKLVPQPDPMQLRARENTPTHVLQITEKYNAKQRDFETITTEVPVTVCEMERAAQQDLQTILRLIDLGKVAVSDKTFFPTAASLATIAPLLSGGDYYDNVVPIIDHPLYAQETEIGSIKPFAWVMLMQAGKLAELINKRLSLTKAGQKALQDKPEKTIATLWQRWLKTKFFDELRRIDSIKGQTGKGKRGLTAPAGRREVIINALKQCPPNQWISVADLFRYMIAEGYDFEVSRQPWNLSQSSYGDLTEGNWYILQARYIVCLLFEYLATLGLLDVAYVHPSDAMMTSDRRSNFTPYISRYDGLSYFRLTALGAYCLGLSDRYTPTPLEVKSVLRILPNSEIVVTQLLSSADQLLLDTYAKKISDHVWKLEQARLLSATEGGRTISGLREFLEARSDEPLPGTVLQFLNDIQNRSESLQDLGTARLIKCADPALAALIANDSRTKPFCFLAGQGKATATYLAVPAETETKFRNALKKLGYSL